MKAKITLKNIWAYIQGNIRYKLYYSPYVYGKKLIPYHIRRQIKCRIDSMNRTCLKNGSCVLCGCQTTALQMANKACDGPCYPAMLSEEKWDKICSGEIIYCTETKLFWRLEDGKFKITYV